MRLRHAVYAYFAIFTVVLGGGCGYALWRQSSLEPLTADIDLTRARTYTYRTNRVHASHYHPAFRLRLPFESPPGWNWGPSYQLIWGESPPEVRIQVRDNAGRAVVDERSVITRENDWIVTGSPGRDPIEVYKFADFRGEMFESYAVTLEVLVASPATASYQTQFVVQTVKAYELLGVVFGNILVWGVAIFVGIVLFATYYLAQTR